MMSNNRLAEAVRLKPTVVVTKSWTSQGGHHSSLIPGEAENGVRGYWSITE
jgi:hypothetical protein